MPQDNPKSEPHLHTKARSEKSKHQLNYNDFRDSKAREEKSGFSLFDPCYVLIWNKRVLD